MMKTPKLARLPIEKAKEHSCPGINGKDTFLCLIDGEYYAGRFSKEWYGWSFDMGSHTQQFDAPGSNSSDWQEVWKIETKTK